MLSRLDIHAARGGLRLADREPLAVSLWAGGEHVMLHRFDMALHRLSGLFRVVPLDGDENLSVGRQRFVGPTRSLQ